MANETFTLPKFDLTGKVAIVTGGTKGLGHGIALKSAAAGAKVVVTSRHQNDCDAVAKAIKELGGEAIGVSTDVQKVDAIENLVKQTVAAFGRLDIMVNNAGVALTKKVKDMSEADWDRVLDSNLKGVFFGSKIAADQMIAQGDGGKIINMCSIGGIKGNNGLSAYGASKAGAINLTKTLAWEYARYGIHVNAICPGYVKTALNADTLENPAFKEKTLKKIPERRFGTVDEIANLTLFLACGLCDMLDGEYIVADMGATLGGDV